VITCRACDELLSLSVGNLVEIGDEFNNHVLKRPTIARRPWRTQRPAPCVALSAQRYAASTSKFIIVRSDLMARPASPVRFWIYYLRMRPCLARSRYQCRRLLWIERGVKDGWIGPSGLDAICDFIRPRVADATHLSGARRCALMRACFVSAAPRRADRQRKPGSAAIRGWIGEGREHQRFRSRKMTWVEFF